MMEHSDSSRGKTEALLDGKTLRVEALAQDGVTPPQAAWYRKPQFAFSHALAAVRLRHWASATFSTSPNAGDTAILPRVLPNRLRRLNGQSRT